MVDQNICIFQKKINAFNTSSVKILNGFKIAMVCAYIKIRLKTNLFESPKPSTSTKIKL